MKRTFLLFCISVMVQVIYLRAQELDRITDLRFYADVMANAELSDSRIRGEAKFNELLHTDLEQNGFWANYDSIAWLQSVLSADSTFRILTWQLEEDGGKHKYFGVVQKEDGSTIELQDRRRLNSEFSNYDQNTWYGALYYGLEEFKLEDGSSAWIVLGFNANDPLTNIKVADVLTFNDDRTVLQLGKPVFKGSLEDGEEVKHRIILQYADAA